jgi:hypothetical protein
MGGQGGWRGHQKAGACMHACMLACVSVSGGRAAKLGAWLLEASQLYSRGTARTQGWRRSVTQHAVEIHSGVLDQLGCKAPPGTRTHTSTQTLLCEGQWGVGAGAAGPGRAILKGPHHTGTTGQAAARAPTQPHTSCAPWSAGARAGQAAIGTTSSGAGGTTGGYGFKA